MKYSDVLKNKNFVEIAAILRNLYTVSWRRENHVVAADSLINDMTMGLAVELYKENKQPAFAAIINALVAVGDASGQRHTTENAEWLVSVFDMDDSKALAILWLLMAYSSAPDENLTPDESASITGTAASTWRNRAAAGDIPGAWKKGKQWLLPKSVVTRSES